MATGQWISLSIRTHVAHSFSRASRCAAVKRAARILVLLAPLALATGARAEEPRYFAIRNARIVPVSGPVIEAGTVVIAKGLITAVGPDVPIPA
jgi:hypothetical protein